MTPRERKLFDFLRAYIGRAGVPPTFVEMQAEIGCASKSGVHKALAALERQGMIAREPRRYRGIVILADNPAYTDTALEALPEDAFRRLEAAVQAERRSRRAIGPRLVNARFA